MDANILKAQEILFGKEGLGASNFKMFQGTNNDVASEQIAAVLAASLERLASGKLEEATLD